MKYVPTLWEVDEVIIIPKPSKLAYDESSYRINCLIVILSILFEKKYFPRELESSRVTKPLHCSIFNSAQNSLLLITVQVINSRGKENSFGNQLGTLLFKLDQLLFSEFNQLLKTSKQSTFYNKKKTTNIYHIVTSKHTCHKEVYLLCLMPAVHQLRKLLW